MQPFGRSLQMWVLLRSFPASSDTDTDEGRNTMKTTMKFLAAGLLAGALTFVGCKSDSSAERPADTTQTTPATGEQGTGTGTEGTGTSTGTSENPGTGGSGDISKTKQSDDNLRMPREDPLRTPEQESIRDAESESEPDVHDNPGIGGSGFPDDDSAVDETLNPGGNIDDTLRTPGSPADIVPDDSLSNDSLIPEGER
jgi:hypothetical protein